MKSSKLALLSEVSVLKALGMVVNVAMVIVPLIGQTLMVAVMVGIATHLPLTPREVS
jgi:hypothetical protein